MKLERALALTSAAILIPLMSFAQAKEAPAKGAGAPAQTDAAAGHFAPESKTTTGQVTVGGSRIEYDAVAGTLVVHPEGWDDAAAADKGSKGAAGDLGNPTAEASMFYVAYFKHGATAEARPLTFLFNGGPGSSTIWLHMGAFGPRRIVTAEDSHTPAAPYRVVNNDQSLLDASDLVFIDAPGTGFSRIAGQDAEKSFYGFDPDAHAFAEFVSAFLSKYGRWNSPKYLFGESYGTPRAAMLVSLLQSQYSIDFNGVIMLSQILNFDLFIDGPESNPGVDVAYLLALPTYAATAWYHHKLPGPNPPRDLEPFLQEVETFAMGDYAHALAQGAQLTETERDAVADKLHQYTGLPVGYILKADLRINGGEFAKTLQQDTDSTTGRLDSRFTGPTIDPLSQKAEYDPQAAAIAPAYVAAFNDYVRKTLSYGQDKTYRPITPLFQQWDMKHSQPGAKRPPFQAPNTMPDLARAMILNPGLKILLTGGYFDLATPFYQGWYEMHHLTIPAGLQDNIQYRYYPSGHMVYANQASLTALHKDVAAFIESTANQDRK
ncbi:MAG TPA: peptidase S10 [Candidatus Polarisedimenticolia bacterium]|nr:peptidase S10 [Candidatus Polarisedimenticolia bacterium]